MTAHEGAARVSRRGVAAGLAAAGIAGLGAAGMTQAQEATPSPTPPVPPDFKVVLHASDPDHWPYVLSNLTNLTAQWPKAHLRLVVDGTAVYGLQGATDVTTKLGQMAEAGAVEVQVCPNALHEHGIDPSTLPSWTQITLGGVVALVSAQRDGYAYVKP